MSWQRVGKEVILSTITSFSFSPFLWTGLLQEADFQLHAIMKGFLLSSYVKYKWIDSIEERVWLLGNQWFRWCGMAPGDGGRENRRGRKSMQPTEPRTLKGWWDWALEKEGFEEQGFDITHCLWVQEGKGCHELAVDPELEPRASSPSSPSPHPLLSLAASTLLASDSLIPFSVRFPVCMCYFK